MLPEPMMPIFIGELFVADGAKSSVEKSAKPDDQSDEKHQSIR